MNNMLIFFVIYTTTIGRCYIPITDNEVCMSVKNPFFLEFEPRTFRKKEELLPLHYEDRCKGITLHIE